MFLIEIGKQCKSLKSLDLSYLGSSRTSYTNELCKMLSHCQSLKLFEIHEVNIGQVSDVLFSLLDKPDLFSVKVNTSGSRNSTKNLTQSVKQLTKNLREFYCSIDGMDEELCDELNGNSFLYV